MVVPTSDVGQLDVAQVCRIGPWVYVGVSAIGFGKQMCVVAVEYCVGMWLGAVYRLGN